MHLEDPSWREEHPALLVCVVQFPYCVSACIDYFIICCTWGMLPKALMHMSCRSSHLLLRMCGAAQVLPRFGMLLADWQPLLQPRSAAVLKEFAAWRPLLESDAQRDNIFQV